MSTPFSAYAERFAGRPLMLHPATAALIAESFNGRGHADAEPEASRFRGMPALNGARYRVENGAAVITIEGPLCNRGVWLGSSWGGACYEGISAQISAALADSTVDRIVLDLDTPGGQAAGTFELAAEVRAASGRKPVTAFVNSMAASAGYAIASAAGRIVVTPSATVGSIGVVMMHLDQSRALDRVGITPTLIYAGAKKVDRSSLAPLSEGVRKDLQSEVDDLYGMFVGAVARNRGMSAAAVRGTEAACYVGASAVKAGLADSVGTFDDALARKSAKYARGAPFYPTGATTPSPVPAASYVPPAPAAQPFTSADLRDAQVDACTQIWRNAGSAAAQSLGFPADVVAEVRSAMQPGIDATWAGVMAGIGGESVPTASERPAQLAPAAASDAWGAVIGKINAEDAVARRGGGVPTASAQPAQPSTTAASDLWGAVIGKINAEDAVARRGGGVPTASAQPAQPSTTAASDLWGAVVGKINADHGLARKDA